MGASEELQVFCVIAHQAHLFYYATYTTYYQIVLPIVFFPRTSIALR